MAGAGTGKTSTLVARILHHALDASPNIPLDRMLVVTFNEAAAAEMRHRLAGALDARLETNPKHPWTAEQRALLDTAQVSTLHAFCLRLVRDHFHDLHLDPQFVVQDNLQNQILQTTVLDDLIHPHLASPLPASPLPANPHIHAFLRRHGRPNLDAVRQRITDIHDYARSLPEPRPWLQQLREAHLDPHPTLWTTQTAPGLARWARGWIDHTRHVARLEPHHPVASALLPPLQLLAAFPAPGSPPPATSLATLLQAAHLPDADKRKANAWRRPFKKLLEEASRLIDFLETDSNPSPGSGPTASALLQDWDDARHDVVALLDLVLAFEQAFAEARRTAGAVDFADLEQLALQLLWDPATRQPTPLARQWRKAIDLVFVDEYQDINGAQDRILQSISRDGPLANRFLVGDVKQSIYRFRRADPRIFQSYARLWRSSNDQLQTVAPLTDNFRSHQAILDFVNRLFPLLMRADAGGVAYDQEAELHVGAPEARPQFLASPEGRIEFLLLVPNAPQTGEPSPSPSTPAPAPVTPPDPADPSDNAADPAAEDPEGAGEDPEQEADLEESQARWAARRLRHLKEQGPPIWDQALGTHRLPRWRDMVVLHPAPRSISERWARAFAAEGVPLDARRAGFFEALEVSDLVHLVRLLDNPRQDLPLLAVLRSPLVGMTVDELALLRITQPTGPLWTALKRLATPATPTTPTPPGPPDNPDLLPILTRARTKAAEFLDAFNRWRRIATQGSLAACLETVLAETAYEAWILAQERADAKRANLHRLLALTRQFDAFQRHGLFRFVQFLEAQADLADPLESAPAAAGDSVRLLSMHQSKGLEFPIVIAAGLGRRFNVDDLNADWLLDPEFGICPPVVPPPPARRYPSLPRCLAAFRQREEMIGEQIRLLYVACTRASDRLLLLGSTRLSRLNSWIERDATPGYRSLIEAQCPLDWIAPALPAVAQVPDLLSQASGTFGSISWSIRPSPPPSSPPPTPMSARPDSAPSASATPATPQLEFHQLFAPDPARDAITAATRRLDTPYPWTTATLEPAKTAVTALRRQWLADDDTAHPNAHTPRPPTTTSAVDRGLAHHVFLERLNLARTTTRDDLLSERTRLVAEGHLSPEHADTLDLDGLAAFWSSPLADLLRSDLRRVHRELPFTLRLDPTDATRLGAPHLATGLAPDDYQVVQGVVDLAWITDDEIQIVDFKTDRVTGSTVASRASEYATQLRLYAHALTAIYRRPVTRRWLFFLATRDLLPVA